MCGVLVASYKALDRRSARCGRRILHKPTACRVICRHFRSRAPMRSVKLCSLYHRAAALSIICLFYGCFDSCFLRKCRPRCSAVPRYGHFRYMRCRGTHTFFGSCGASEKSKRQSAALPFAFEIKENIKDGGIQESNLEKIGENRINLCRKPCGKILSVQLLPKRITNTCWTGADCRLS